jgi:hypothetical protein
MAKIRKSVPVPNEKQLEKSLQKRRITYNTPNGPIKFISKCNPTKSMLCAAALSHGFEDSYVLQEEAEAAKKDMLKKREEKKEMEAEEKRKAKELREATRQKKKTEKELEITQRRLKRAEEKQAMKIRRQKVVRRARTAVARNIKDPDFFMDLSQFRKSNLANMKVNPKKQAERDAQLLAAAKAAQAEAKAAQAAA